MSNSRKKICLRLIGGVGNQLFCYSYARRLAEESGRELLIDTTTGFVKDDYGRKAKIQSFVREYKECSTYEKLMLLFIKICPKIGLSLWNAVYWKESNANCYKPVNLKELDPVKSIFLEGYFQSYRYLEGYFQLIKDEIQLKIEISPAIQQIFNEITCSNSVAIHVRRIAYNNLLEFAYYESAIALIRKHVESAKFFFFSDDIEWCKANFSFLDLSVFVEHDSDDEVVDLWLMTRCKHHIVANSSFSWWGAWLSEDPDKIVIRPANESIGVDNSFYPTDWLLV